MTSVGSRYMDGHIFADAGTPGRCAEAFADVSRHRLWPVVAGRRPMNLLRGRVRLHPTLVFVTKHREVDERAWAEPGEDLLLRLGQLLLARR